MSSSDKSRNKENQEDHSNCIAAKVNKNRGVILMATSEIRADMDSRNVNEVYVAGIYIAIYFWYALYYSNKKLLYSSL